MHTVQKQLLLSLLISSSSLLHANQSIFDDEIWEEMGQLEQHVQKSMVQMRHVMKNSMSSLKEAPSIMMKLGDAGLRISISHMPLKDRTFDAQFDQDNNLLSISAPTGTISIQNRTLANKQTYITAMLTHQEQQESDKNKAFNSFSSHAQVSQTIDGEIEMGQATIEYDAQAQELIITIPPRKRIFSKIPVNFKEPKENK